VILRAGIKWRNKAKIWNIKKTAGTNIVGGPYLGGDYCPADDHVFDAAAQSKEILTKFHSHFVQLINFFFTIIPFFNHNGKVLYD